jgi:hypothetical protein
MRSNFTIQEQPWHQWNVVQEFGKVEGGLNSGIAKVELKDDPIDNISSRNDSRTGMCQTETMPRKK